MTETTGLADELRETRQDRGLSQADVAEQLGVSQPTVGNWERGKTALGRPNRVHEWIANPPEPTPSDCPSSPDSVSRTPTPARTLSESYRRFGEVFCNRCESAVDVSDARTVDQARNVWRTHLRRHHDVRGPDAWMAEHREAVGPRPPVCDGVSSDRHAPVETHRWCIDGDPRWTCPVCSMTLETWPSGAYPR